MMMRHAPSSRNGTRDAEDTTPGSMIPIIAQEKPRPRAGARWKSDGAATSPRDSRRGLHGLLHFVVVRLDAWVLGDP